MALVAPRSLSPSKVTAFTDCPLAFRFSIIDRLPEPPSPQAVKGTLVHAAMERLFWANPRGTRTPEAGSAALELAWRDLGADEEFLALGLSDDECETAFLADAGILMSNYFLLEDPNAVREVGVELGLEVDVGDIRAAGSSTAWI